MKKIYAISLAVFSATLVAAQEPKAQPNSQEPSWNKKPVSDWTDEDARQVLAGSPWSGAAQVTFMAGKDEDKIRQGGQMGSERPRAPFKALTQSIFTGVGGKPYVYKTPDPPPVQVVWGSAMPIRAAELKLGATGTGDWDGHYVIAVFGVPTAMTKRSGMLHDLKQMAHLKLDQKRTLKPARVSIVETDDSTSAVIFEFRRSEEISKNDERVAFYAQISRLYITEYFYPVQMTFAGKIEL